MTNFEKYKDIIEGILKNGCSVGIKGDKLLPCHETHCADCKFKDDDDVLCEVNFFKWGMQEYVETKRLTKEEYCFCVAAKSGWIARDDEGLSYFNTDIEWSEEFGNWDFVDDGDYININECMPHLKFSSIGMNEKYNIEELLQMEVSDDE